MRLSLWLAVTKELTKMQSLHFACESPSLRVRQGCGGFISSASPRLVVLQLDSTGPCAED